MRRLSLSAKLLVAALPLLVAIGALLVVATTNAFGDVNEARRGAQLGRTWEPLIDGITSIENEQSVAEAGGSVGEINEARRVTNEVMVEINAALNEIGDSQPLVLQLGQAMASLGLAREAIDAPDLAEARNATAGASYDDAENSLITLGRLLPAEAADVQLGRELTAVAALAEVEQAGTSFVEETMAVLETEDPAALNLDRVIFYGTAMGESVDLFQAVAPEEWTREFREAGFPRALRDGEWIMDQLLRYDPASGEDLPGINLEPLMGPAAEIGPFRDQLAAEAVARADAEADDLQRQTLIRTGITLGAVLLAFLLAWFITRSITRRVRAVKDKANEVSTTQLPALVSALSDPRSRGTLPEVAPIHDKGADEVAELAAAFNAVQSTLVEVAQEQVEVLRRGVSDIFVTMARRNRSLVDRQLALLDELEAEVDDPDVLANYYQLDHLATRMRRNSEGLLVLANAESKRRRVKATEIDDVIRAAISEVEDYRRVDVLHLESLQVRGSVVADLAHLLAELLDNATSFSPPDSRVRVAGGHIEGHYLITIADEGVGVSPERLNELNELLSHPPIVGLSVEPTLGLSVVSLLANKHRVQVALAASSPGVTVEVLLPPDLYGPIDAGLAGGGAATESLTVGAGSNGHGTHDFTTEQLVEWADDTSVELGLGAGGGSTIPPLTPEPEFTPMPATTGLVADLPTVPSDPLTSSDLPDAGESPDVSEPAFAAIPTPTPSVSPTGASHDVGDTGAGVEDAAAEPVVPVTELTPVAPAAEDEVDLASFVIEPEWTKTPSTNGDRNVVATTTGSGLVADLPVRSTEPAVSDLPSRSTEPARPIDPGLPVRRPTEHQPVAAMEPDRLAVPAPPAPEAEASPAPVLSAPVAGAVTAPNLPPPPPGASSGEFDRPPAPPTFGSGPTPRPVVDPSARPLPPRKPADATPAHGTGLPVRARGANGPDAGPDRLSEQPMVVPAVPSSLQAALRSFDQGRNGHQPSLPTRAPGSSGNGDVHGPADTTDSPESIAKSRLDPDAIRQRLRAFQTEYRFGRGDDDTHGNGNGNGTHTDGEHGGSF